MKPAILLFALAVHAEDAPKAAGVVTSMCEKTCAPKPDPALAYQTARADAAEAQAALLQRILQQDNETIVYYQQAQPLQDKRDIAARAFDAAKDVLRKACDAGLAAKECDAVKPPAPPSK